MRKVAVFKVLARTCMVRGNRSMLESEEVGAMQSEDKAFIKKLGD